MAKACQPFQLHHIGHVIDVGAFFGQGCLFGEAHFVGMKGVVLTHLGWNTLTDSGLPAARKPTMTWFSGDRKYAQHVRVHTSNKTVCSVLRTLLLSLMLVECTLRPHDRLHVVTMCVKLRETETETERATWGHRIKADSPKRKRTHPYCRLLRCLPNK